MEIGENINCGNLEIVEEEKNWGKWKLGNMEIGENGNFGKCFGERNKSGKMELGEIVYCGKWILGEMAIWENKNWGK